jgi:enoyl-CoA hydratase/carnithine racemase
MGLVNEVVPAAQLDARIDALVHTLRAASPAALRRGKQVMCAMQMMAFEEALSYAEAQIGMASRSADAAEGLQAFADKRPPRWAG